MLDVTCKAVAEMIKGLLERYSMDGKMLMNFIIPGKTPEEIRKQFNIKNDFTPEEEEQVREENAWCEDGR